jgi:hypothetical protein
MSTEDVFGMPASQHAWREEMYARYGRPVRLDTAAILASLDLGDVDADQFMAFQYPSMECAELFAFRNREYYDLDVIGPFPNEDGAYAILDFRRTLDEYRYGDAAPGITGPFVMTPAPVDEVFRG